MEYGLGGRFILSMTVHDAARMKSQTQSHCWTKRQNLDMQLWKGKLLGGGLEIQPEDNSKDDTFPLPRNLW